MSYGVFVAFSKRHKLNLAGDLHILADSLAFICFEISRVNINCELKGLAVFNLEKMRLYTSFNALDIVNLSHAFDFSQLDAVSVLERVTFVFVHSDD